VSRHRQSTRSGPSVTSPPLVLRLVGNKWKRQPANDVHGNCYLIAAAVSGKRQVAVGAWLHEGHVDVEAHAVIESRQRGIWRSVPTSVD
jgi:hypothetical protein